MSLQLRVSTVEEMLGQNQLFRDMLSHRITLLKPIPSVERSSLSLVDLVSERFILTKRSVPDDRLMRMPVVVIPKQNGALPILTLSAYMHPFRLEEIAIAMCFSECFNPHDKPQDRLSGQERSEVTLIERTLISQAIRVNQLIFQEERIFHMRLGLTIVEEKIRLVTLASCYYGGKGLMSCGDGKIPIFDVPMGELDLHIKWEDED